jgi:hypothetical protein
MADRCPNRLGQKVTFPALPEWVGIRSPPGLAGHLPLGPDSATAVGWQHEEAPPARPARHAVGTRRWRRTTKGGVKQTWTGMIPVIVPVPPGQVGRFSRSKTSVAFAQPRWSTSAEAPGTWHRPPLSTWKPRWPTTPQGLFTSDPYGCATLRSGAVAWPHPIGPPRMDPLSPPLPEEPLSPCPPRTGHLYPRALPHRRAHGGQGSDGRPIQARRTSDRSGQPGVRATTSSDPKGIPEL